MQPNLLSAETNTDRLYQLNNFLKRLAADVYRHYLLSHHSQCEYHFWQVNQHSAAQMKNVRLDETLFDKFLEMLASKDIKPQGGTLVDGTFVEKWRVVSSEYLVSAVLVYDVQTILATRHSPL
jgi:hypothetical protein